VAGISGAGGSGKTVLLQQIERQLQETGAPVHRDLAAAERSGHTAGGALLVDDAHELSDHSLARLHALVDGRSLDLVVAYRPWPSMPALRRLAGALEHHRPPVVLGPLSRQEIAASAVAVLGGHPTGALVEQVWQQTGGMPWLVHRMLRLHAEEGAGPRAEARVLQRLIDQLGYELAELDGEVHELLLALAIGFDLSTSVPAALRFDDTNVDSLVTNAQGKGLLLHRGEVVPIVRRALIETTPAYHVRAVQRALVDALAGNSRALDSVARRLAQDGLHDVRVAESLVAAADQVLATCPAIAFSLYGEALAAGADEVAIASRRAQAAVTAGELDDAGRILDELFENEDIPDVRRGVDSFAALWAERGMLAHSAETYRWLGPERVGTSAPLAAVTLIGVGDAVGAECMMAAGGRGTPTLPSVAVRLMGDGVRSSLDGNASAALPTLIRAADTMTASGVALPMPETPAGLAALVAIRSGELSVAASVLDAAVQGGHGGPAARTRLLLLRGWVAMREDRPDQASACVAEATAGEHALSPRNELLLRALELGLARRTDDAAGMLHAWHKARESMLHVPVDLFSLLPLEEFVISAARLRESHRLEIRLAEAWSLLDRLGNPPLWSVPLHWASVQAAILTDRPAELGPHAAALVRASKQSRTAAVLAAAGRSWVAVLAGVFEPAAVESAARGLARVGLTWDGSRLAGHAAAHADDRRDVARLLACARDLRPSTRRGTDTEAQPVTAAATSRAETPAGEPVLTPREREVARLILEGKNYREIGEAIFISPRTVEHHIARIRTRFDVKTRSELLDRLRLILEGGADADRDPGALQADDADEADEA
jgi:DNA-binding CsgD family transcriptional regulator